MGPWPPPPTRAGARHGRCRWARSGGPGRRLRPSMDGLLAGEEQCGQAASAGLSSDGRVAWGGRRLGLTGRWSARAQEEGRGGRGRAAKGREQAERLVSEAHRQSHAEDERRPPAASEFGGEGRAWGVRRVGARWRSSPRRRDGRPSRGDSRRTSGRRAKKKEKGAFSRISSPHLPIPLDRLPSLPPALARPPQPPLPAPPCRSRRSSRIPAQPRRPPTLARCRCRCRRSCATPSPRSQPTCTSRSGRTTTDGRCQPRPSPSSASRAGEPDSGERMVRCLTASQALSGARAAPN